MAKIVPLDAVSSGLGGQVTLNQNSDKIEAAFQNTLSRDGSSPNEMNANLDMNSFRILNAIIDPSSLLLDVDLIYTAGTRVLSTDTVGLTATLPIFDATDAGLVPNSTGSATEILAGDGTWIALPGGVTNLTWNAGTSQVESDTGTNATLVVADGTNPGLLPVLSTVVTEFLNGTGAFSVPPDTSTDVTLGAIGSSPNANAATLTGQVLNLEPADGTFGGVLTALAQTIAGAKTLTATLTAQNINPVSTGLYSLGDGYLVGALDWERINSNTGAIMRVQGLGTTSATNIRAMSNAIGCTAQAGNATSTAYIDLGSGSGGLAITNCFGAAAFAAKPGTTCVIEMLGTSGTNLGSAVNVLGSHVASTARVQFTLPSSGSMNLGSALIEGASALAEIIISGDGVFNAGNCRDLGGTMTLAADSVVNLGTLLGGTLTISGASSFNLGTVLASATMSISGIGSYNMARISTGALDIQGAGCLNLGSIDDSGSTITLVGNNVQNSMSVTGGADVTASVAALGAYIRGLATDDATVSLTGAGCVIQGYYLGRAATSLTASGTGSFLNGTVDVSGASGTPGAVALSSTGVGSVLFGSVSAVTAGAGTSTITSGGTGSVVLGHIELSSASPALMEATSIASFAGGAVLSGSLRSIGESSYSWGYVSGTNAALLSSGRASTCNGYISATSTGPATSTASGSGSVNLATVTNTGSGTASATNSSSGSVFLGYVSAGGAANSTVSITQSGAVIMGACIRSGGTSSTMSAGGFGSIVLGGAFAGTLSATVNGAFVRGYVSSNGTITSTASGAEAAGRAIARTITASGIGSTAKGYAQGSFDISAIGDGSFAQGWSINGHIIATAANSVQFGPGNNTVADSVQVGDSTGTGLWLLAGGVPGAPVNGQIWKTVTTGRVSLHSAGQTISLYQQGAAGASGWVTGGAANAVQDLDTFTGGTGATAYTIGDIVAALKTIGLIAA